MKERMIEILDGLQHGDELPEEFLELVKEHVPIVRINKYEPTSTATARGISNQFGCHIYESSKIGCEGSYIGAYRIDKVWGPGGFK
jgi:hypothetical protein